MVCWFDNDAKYALCTKLLMGLTCDSKIFSQLSSVLGAVHVVEPMESSSLNVIK